MTSVKFQKSERCKLTDQYNASIWTAFRFILSKRCCTEGAADTVRVWQVSVSTIGQQHFYSLQTTENMHTAAQK